MRFFIDTEFSEDGPTKPITLISIGIVAEDGRELYLIHSDFSPDDCNDWVKANVLPNLGNGPRFTLDQIRARTEAFIGEEPPEIWGYYADYDWVVFCQIFGAMVNLPKGWPMFCRDLEQMVEELGNPILPEQSSTEHNALNDARWNKQVFEFLMEKTKDFRIVGKDSGAGMILNERILQINVEGFTSEHDDQYAEGALAQAASCYALAASSQSLYRTDDPPPMMPQSWPWSQNWWKPKDRIRNLTRAGALIAAEIDRLQRKEKHHDH